MTKEKLRHLHNYVYAIYSTKMTIEFDDLEEDDFGSYLISRRVVLPKIIIAKPSEWSLFAFLHEVGHIITNTPKMNRYEQEFLATQWALDKAKEIGFEVPQKYIKTYQTYIFDWYDCAKKSGLHRMSSRNNFRLKY